MAKRRYTMTRRARALQETRRKILEATMELHDEGGIADARWDEIARHAGLSLSTMYRHFPSNEDLIAACGRLTFEQFPPPDPAAAPAVFADLRGLKRLERLVDEVYGYYERTNPMMAMLRRDMDRSPAVADGFKIIQAGVEAFILEASAPFEIDDNKKSLVRALLDDRFWASLIDAGLLVSDARRECSRLIRTVLQLEAPTRP